MPAHFDTDAEDAKLASVRAREEDDLAPKDMAFRIQISP
jgi:hypothetical protein